MPAQLPLRTAVAPPKSGSAGMHVMQAGRRLHPPTLPPVRKSTAVAAEAAGDLALMLNSSASSTQNTPAQEMLQGRGAQWAGIIGAWRQANMYNTPDWWHAAAGKACTHTRCSTPCLSRCPPEGEDEGAHAGDQEGLEGEPVGDAQRAQRGGAPRAAPHQQRAAAQRVDEKEGQQHAQHLPGGEAGGGDGEVRQFTWAGGGDGGVRQFTWAVCDRPAAIVVRQKKPACRLQYLGAKPPTRPPCCRLRLT